MSHPSKLERITTKINHMIADMAAEQFAAGQFQGPNEREDVYALHVARCELPGRQREIRDRAVQKFMDHPEHGEMMRLADVTGFTYCLPEGAKNPIKEDDPEFEGKVTVEVAREPFFTIPLPSAASTSQKKDSST
ncbi:hypothetical protein LTR17_004832 [Elasticomyces elasticus]|nr:hypothetical protein LTR17_004832 [Elasticomyces elasticus]